MNAKSDWSHAQGDYHVVKPAMASLCTNLNEDPMEPQPIVSKEKPMPFSTVRSTDPRMRQIFELISNLGQTNSTVLIEGETGTGKEVIAAAVHSAEIGRAHV